MSVSEQKAPKTGKQNIVGSICMLTMAPASGPARGGSAGFVKTLVDAHRDELDLKGVDGAQMMQAAICANDVELVKYYLGEGMDADNVPNQIQPMPTDQDAHKNYRKTPFLIQCAQIKDSIEMFMELGAAGCRYDETGTICLSRVRGNTVQSNCLAAAAYYGNETVIPYALKKLGKYGLEYRATESADTFFDKKRVGTPVSDEYAGFTPLQLAVVSPTPSLVCIELLLDSGADKNVLQNSTRNNLLHLSLTHSKSEEVIWFLVEKVKMNIHEKNKKGQSAMDMAKQKGNEDAIRIFEISIKANDNTNVNALDLMAELEEEEKKKQLAAEKKRQKKLNALAKKKGVSVEELALNKLQQERDQKAEEKAKEEAILKAEQQEVIDRQARLQEQQDEYERELAQQKLEQKEAAAARRAEKAEQEKKKKEVKTQEEKPAVVQKKQNEKKTAQPTKSIVEEDLIEKKSEVEPVAVPETKKDAPKKPTIVGLSGEMATKALGKQAKKKIADKAKREKEEEEEMRARILKAKADHENEKKLASEKDKIVQKKKIEDDKKLAQEKKIQAAKEEEERKRMNAELAAQAKEKKLQFQQEREQQKKEKAAKLEQEKAAQEAAPVAAEVQVVEEKVAVEAVAPKEEASAEPKEGAKKNNKKAKKEKSAKREEVVEAAAEVKAELKEPKKKAEKKEPKEKSEKKEPKEKSEKKEPKEKSEKKEPKEKSEKKEPKEKSEKKEPKEKSEKKEPKEKSEKKEKVVEYRAKEAPAQSAPSTDDSEALRLDYSKRLEEMASQVESYQAEVASQKTNLKALTDENKLVNAEIVNMVDENVQLRQKVSDRQSEVSVNEQATNSSERELTLQLKKLQSKFQAQVKANATLTESSDRMDKQLREEKQKRTDLEKQFVMKPNQQVNSIQDVIGFQYQLDNGRAHHQNNYR